MDLGKRINELRSNAGLTQEQLAEKLEISRQAVTKWENGDSIPDVEKLVELSSLFGVSIDYLVKGRRQCTINESVPADGTEGVISFLCRAKKNTYAANGNSEDVESSRQCSRDLFYGDGKYEYLDSYFGGERFIGEEVLYVNKAPFWAMNYSGRVLDRNFSGDFLKECLTAVKSDKPYRGPEILQNGNFTYHCNVKGEFDWFQGEEQIFFQNMKVYECLFHGGIIK